MNPIFFGSKRTLFGIRAEPEGELKQTAILICPSWGAELMRSHLSLRLLSEQLAKKGFDVLRFDYSCTGDSYGDAAEADPDRWLDDITVAADELLRYSGVRDVCLVGVRLGALLALQAMRKWPAQSSSLALWDPPLSGAQWIEQQQQLNETLREQKNRYSPGADLLPKRDDELIGHVFPSMLSQKIEQLHLPMQPVATTKIFTSQDTQLPAATFPDAHALPNPAYWNDAAWLHRQWTPTQSLHLMAQQLAATLP